VIDFDNPPTMARDYRGTIEVYPHTVYARVTHRESTEWRWRCRSKNNQIIGSGEGYTRKSGALNAVEAQYAVRLTGTVTTRALRSAVVPWRLVIDGQVAKIGALY
jgi:uncharacterized protein YegP (UPF0339 family)